MTAHRVTDRVIGAATICLVGYFSGDLG